MARFGQKRAELSPGTVLVREWDRQSQRVMVMADGFAWNGQPYDSLSKVAFAITGNKWNGPRFFGLRNKEDRSAMELSHEGSFGQAGPLRDLYEGLHRSLPVSL